METLPAFLKGKIREHTHPNANPLAYALVRYALSDMVSGVPLSQRLAASFDLLVASKFYQYTRPEEWLWCGHSGRDFYPTLNVCPNCVLDNRFVHTNGHKPGSGQIGPTTALAFREIIAAYFDLTGKASCIVCNASEPIDLAIADTENKVLFVAEVKAAPLFTPPLFRQHTTRSIQTQHTLPLNHSIGVSRNLHEAVVSLFVPDTEVPLEIPLEAGAVGGGIPLDESLATVIKEDYSIASRFFQLWSRMWDAYQRKDSSDILYWYCGACGLPPSPGEGWPREANGRPKGSISDGKTSVGIDRTDDIKKATFQVLKLGVDNRLKDPSPWRLLIGLASNVHAARHYDGYLRPYEEIVWGWAGTDEQVKNLYNLFDGIVSFTRSHMRDDWLSRTLDWHGGNHA